jgi:hypothetical protein
VLPGLIYYLLPKEGQFVLQRIGCNILLVGELLHLLVHLSYLVLQRLDEFIDK